MIQSSLDTEAKEEAFRQDTDRLFGLPHPVTALAPELLPRCTHPFG